MSYDIPFLERSNIIIKRFFDILLSIVLLFLTMPLHIILYIIYGYKNTKMWTIENKHINIKSFNIKNNFFKKIPILFSILNGKISFVGSRLTSINEKYPSHILKPGLLSLNNTKRFKNNNEQRLETYYIKNQSLTFDLEIILKTVFKV